MNKNNPILQESKEFAFAGTTLNGIAMLLLTIFVWLFTIGAVVLAILSEDFTSDAGLQPTVLTCSIVTAVVSFIVAVLLSSGFVKLEPGEARVCVFFGNYRGTFTLTGYHWINPFIQAKQVSMRARNLEIQPIKVNDKIGNPVMIGLVLVWKVKDSYKAFFEIDAQTMAASASGQSVATNVGHVMQALENFVKVQSDAALRQVAGQYAYDNDGDATELTLRSGGEEINDQLEAKLNERLAMAGIEVIEARLNYLAYAPEIAAVMLRRQQATAIISAREKIVEGAISMVKMALERISEDAIVELDEDKKAAMVSNLLVVLCADEAAQPVVNTGTLHQ